MKSNVCRVLRAPAGCLQYFTGNAGTIKSFNWLDGGGDCSSTGGCWTQSQDYYACVRKEEGIYIDREIYKLYRVVRVEVYIIHTSFFLGMCSIQYTPTQLTDATKDAFELTVTIATALVLLQIFLELYIISAVQFFPFIYCNVCDSFDLARIIFI